MPAQAYRFSQEITRTQMLDYLLYLPDDYGQDPTRRWPLILFLHGVGERGTDVSRVALHGPLKAAEDGTDLPFIVIAPQCPLHHWWSDFQPALIGLVDEVSAAYAVDPARVYLTGLSMGGFGAWHLAVEYPERFAAVAPICGGGLWAFDFPERVTALRDVPVWAFHGLLDDVVPVQETAKLVAALQDAGGNVKMTIYPDKMHDSWTETYANPELYAWLLSHHR
jgi:predicted peptidase